MSSEYKFCPYCGIGLEGSEIRMRFCQNCKEHWDKPEEDFFEEDDDDDIYSAEDEEEDRKEREYEELAERAYSCKCGAWQFNKSGNVIHVADCYCGAE